MDQNRVKPNFQYWLGLLDAMQLREDEWCVICPFGIGDTYFVCALADQFLRHNGGNRFSVVVRPGQEDIPLLFPNISRIFMGEGINLDIIKQWSSFQPGNPIIGHPRYYEDGLLELLCGGNGVTLLDLYYRIFRITPRVPLQRPQVPECYRQSAGDKFKAAGLPAGKTVILAPHANSSKTIPLIYWQSIAAALIERGWTAVTNMTPQNPYVIPGTMPVSFSLGEAIPFSELAGRVISSRSGLCDLLAAAKCKLTVLYLRQNWNAGTVLTGCSLKKMGLSNDAVELEITLNEALPATIRKIVES